MLVDHENEWTGFCFNFVNVCNICKSLRLCEFVKTFGIILFSKWAPRSYPRGPVHVVLSRVP